MKVFIIASTILVLVISGCSPSISTPPPTTTPLPIVEPTITPLPPTASPTPESTSTPVAEENLTINRTTWEDLPMLPDAANGEPAGLGYVYSANVSIETAEEYYLAEMEADGWELLGRQVSETSMFGGPATIMDYQRGDEVVNIMLVFSASENYTMVVLSVMP